MDDALFDTLIRSLGRSRSRRGLARFLGALTFGGTFTALGFDEAAAAKRIGGSTCSRDSQCKAGDCLGNGKCSCSKDFAKCKQPRSRCKQADCVFAGKVCVNSNKTGPCRGDGNRCTKDVCQNGKCTHPPDKSKNGTPCGAGKVCHNGACCTPNCAGKVCGSDGCGGSCGACPTFEDCVDGECAVLAADCPAGAELCAGDTAECADNPDCHCFRRREGGTRCVEFTLNPSDACDQCDTDADCIDLGFPQGTSCVRDHGPICSCAADNKGACGQPCGFSAAANAATRASGRGPRK